MSTRKPHLPLKLDGRKKTIETSQDDDWARKEYTRQQWYERGREIFIITLTFIVVMSCIKQGVRWEITSISAVLTYLAKWLRF